MSIIVAHVFDNGKIVTEDNGKQYIYPLQPATGVYPYRWQVSGCQDRDYFAQALGIVVPNTQYTFVITLTKIESIVANYEPVIPVLK